MRRRSFLLGLTVLLAGVLAGASPAHANFMTFHLRVGDVFASVGQTNAFLVSLGKQVPAVKLVPGGTKFAGLTCAGFGDVYKLASVTVLDGAQAFPDLVTTKKGKDAVALGKAFSLASPSPWTPPSANAETDQQFWTTTNVTHGLQFAAEALTAGNDSGLLGTDASTGVFRFAADVSPTVVAGAPYRFLVELVGQTASTDNGLVAFGRQRCFTFVDLVPVDVSVLDRLVNETLQNVYIRSALASRMTTLKTSLLRRDYAAVFEMLGSIVERVIARSPEQAPPVEARRIVTGAFDVRRGLTFRAASAECGNEIREGGEACDGADFGGFTCGSLGYVPSDNLACDTTCLFDYSGCVAMPVCGNGVLEVGEECDTGSNNSDTIPDACRTTCKLASCGDKVIDVFEDCEGKEFGYGVKNCKDLGYEGGTLKCDPDYCEFDDTHCDEGD